MRRAAVLLPLALAASACFPPATLTPGGREKVVQSLSRQPRYLRVAAYVGPFYRDVSRVLLSDRPPAEIEVLETPDGTPIVPPAPDRVLPPGTPVFVDTVQFPTGTVIWSRPLTTPRYQPWLLATVQGIELPAVLLLSATATEPDDVLAEAGRVLSADDPTLVFRALPDAQRAAVLAKEPLEGMGREAVAMAWGYPDKIVMDRRARTEEWSWSAGRRRALFQDDRLARFETVRSPPASGTGAPSAGAAAPAPGGR
jgi:hypothetical protein